MKYSISNPKILRSIYIPYNIDIELKKQAAEKGTDKSKLYKIGAEIVLALIEYGAIPQCLIELLASQNKKTLLEELRKLLGGVVIVGQ